jgi:hypothetical protein
LTGTFNTTLNVSDTLAGYITINTVDIKEGTIGVLNQPYPWNGVYFNDIPITLKAKANPGFIFTHWSGDITSTSDSIVLNRDTDLQIQANFINDTTPMVVHFWMFDNNLPNNTPLDSIQSTYTERGNHASIKYTSCLPGHPFTSSHQNWRKASLERRNAPTSINYRSQANNDLPFASTDMRGVQVKQPFRLSNQENTLVFEIPTRGYKDIIFSFAAEDAGAAEFIEIDYWNGSDWSQVGLDNPRRPLGSTYSAFEYDFSNVSQANHNHKFKVRMRFDGTNMTVNNGDRVHLNNIAVEGKNTLSVSEAFTPTYFTRVFPNPTEGSLNIEANERIESFQIRSLNGQVVLSGEPNANKTQVNIEALPQGMYFVLLQFRQGSKVVRVIKN